VNPLLQRTLETVRQSPRLVYWKEPTARIIGNLVSNELDRFTLTMPGGRAPGWMMGVGTSTLWDIAFRRAPAGLLIFDGCPEVIAMHEAFYRPLFLAAATPEAFLSMLLSRFDPEQMSVVLKHVDIPLRPFAETILNSALSTIDKFPFENIAIHRGFRETWRLLTDRSELSRATRMPRIFLRMKRFSFLASPESYQIVRHLYLENRVRFAVADLRDDEWFRRASAFLTERHTSVSDLCVSNIPSLLQKLVATPRATLAQAWQPLRERGGDLTVYETLGLALPFRYVTTKGGQ
jgi:hypothetical protein